MAVEVHDGWPDIEKELTCSICTDILYQPLTLLNCLHTFCGSCLKEWFTWQATAATQGRSRNVGTTPYTCPQCRDVVRDTKADWRLTTLLEGYLKAHPGRGKTDAEKEEMRRLYKPGDNVIPPVAMAAEQVDSEDERLMTEIRDLSMRDLESESSRRRTARSRANAGRGHETHDGMADERRTQPLPSSGRTSRPQSNTGDNHRIEHQNSLRSLLGASPVQVGDVQQEILQSIYAEGVLDGIDLDNLTPEQEEELTERIAEAYRRRQRRRDRSRNHESRQQSSQSPQSSAVAPTPSSEERQQETTSHASRTRPPLSRPHLFEQSNAPSSRAHRRTHSAGRGTTSQPVTREGSAITIHPASRSATDLSERPRPAGADRERRRRVSSEARSRAETQTVPLRERNRHRASSSHATPRMTQNPETPPVQHVSRERPAEMTSERPRSNPAPNSSSAEEEIRPMPSQAALAPEPIENLQILRSSESLSIQCNRCRRQGIQYDLHYHCSRCRKGDYHVCLACYRDGQGCDHWFGFGLTAHERFRRLEPPEGWPANYEKPHILSARRYLPPNNPSTSNHPTLEEGAFCEICFSFCDDFYWSCAYCMDGAWGFCKVCVQQGKHCTHPLLPVSRITDPSSTIPPTHNNDTNNHPRPSSIRLPHLPSTHSYRAVTDATDCDLCHRPIATTNTRYHCYHCNGGNYDICTECYYGLVATGKIRQSNGPNGWRKCLQNHRMVIVGFQEVPKRGFQRVTVRDPVGGWRWKDAVEEGQSRRSTETTTATGTSGTHGPKSPSLSPPADGTLGMRCLAAWNRFPGAEVADELRFPKNAEIREVEAKNADWCLGVYAGSVGLFPSNHVRML